MYGKSASVCGHYGTTAIIRDFPFAPYLFLVSHVHGRALVFVAAGGVYEEEEEEDEDEVREKRRICSARLGNEKRATNGFSAALVRVHSDETMERAGRRRRRR